jgi:hypothetical protein
MHDDTLKLIKPVKENDSGHVVIDSRGRNVWQWKDAEVDSTSLVLKRLENDALELEPTRKVPIQKPPAEGAERGGGRRSGHSSDRRKPAPGRRAGASEARGTDRESARRAARGSDRTGRHPERPGRVRLSIDEPGSSGPGGGFDPYNRS